MDHDLSRTASQSTEASDLGGKKLKPKSLTRRFSAKFTQATRKVKEATLSELQRDANGFLTLGTLLAAKRGEVKRVVKLSQQATSPMEHWVFDADTATGSRIALSEFERIIRQKAKHASIMHSRSGRRLNSLIMKANGAMDGDSEMDLPNGTRGAGDTASASGGSQFNVLAGTQPETANPATPKKVEIDNTVADATDTRSTKSVTGIGGEWFHSFGADHGIMEALKKVFHVRQEDIDAAETPSAEGPTLEFVQGDVAANDYLFILAHELRLETPVTDIVARNKTSASASGQTMWQNMQTFMPTGSSGSANGNAMSGTHVGPSPESQGPAVRDAGSELQLEELQVAIFYFPSHQILISIGEEANTEMLNAARKNLRNRRSATRRDCEISSSGGCTTLLVVLLDALLDQVFPILDTYGDALEGLSLLLAREPSHVHVRLSHKLKTRVTQIRRYTWDFRGLIMELVQDMAGCVDKHDRLQTLMTSAEQIEKEAEAYLSTCAGIENFYASFQDSRMNATLYTLTTATICLLPFQCLTGIWGMNFTHMPELEWQNGYLMFWCLAATILCFAGIYIYKSGSNGNHTVILLDEDNAPPTKSARMKALMQQSFNSQ